MQLTVIDLAGTEKVVMAYTAEWLLSNLWQRALAGELRWPVFVVLEGGAQPRPRRAGRDQGLAHRQHRGAEGRKFGVFLVVITQRPSKIADDTLSQCASQLTTLRGGGVKAPPPPPPHAGPPPGRRPGRGPPSAGRRCAARSGPPRPAAPARSGRRSPR